MARKKKFKASEKRAYRDTVNAAVKALITAVKAGTSIISIHKAKEICEEEGLVINLSQAKSVLIYATLRINTEHKATLSAKYNGIEIAMLTAAVAA